jgi:hypothetical protein
MKADRTLEARATERQLQRQAKRLAHAILQG